MRAYKSPIKVDLFLFSLSLRTSLLPVFLEVFAAGKTCDSAADVAIQFAVVIPEVAAYFANHYFSMLLFPARPAASTARCTDTHTEIKKKKGSETKSALSSQINGNDAIKIHK